MTPVVSLNIPEGVMFKDYIKRLKNNRCFHEEDYIGEFNIINFFLQHFRQNVDSVR